FDNHWNVFAGAGAGVLGQDTSLGLDWTVIAGVRWVFMTPLFPERLLEQFPRKRCRAEPRATQPGLTEGLTVGKGLRGRATLVSRLGARGAMKNQPVPFKCPRHSPQIPP